MTWIGIVLAGLLALLRIVRFFRKRGLNRFGPVGNPLNPYLIQPPPTANGEEAQEVPHQEWVIHPPDDDPLALSVPEERKS